MYRGLVDLMQGTEHVVVTTNVDHAFALHGIDDEHLFATQGDYGLFQCSVPCRQQTWSNEDAVRKMVAAQIDCHVPSELVPTCPWCGAPAAMHLRVDGTFVQDEK